MDSKETIDWDLINTTVDTTERIATNTRLGLNSWCVLSAERPFLTLLAFLLFSLFLQMKWRLVLQKIEKKKKKLTGWSVKMHIFSRRQYLVLFEAINAL